MSILPRRRNAQSVPAAAGTDTAHQIVMSERMPSHIASVFFTVRVKGAWRPTHDGTLDHQEPATLARHHLRQNITRVLCQHSVLHLAAAQDAANSALMRWLRPAAGLEITGAVALTASTSDRDLAEENARRQQTADLEHEDELRRLAHLQRVLADPDLRRVWWVARHPDRHSDLEGFAENLKGLPLPQESPDDDVRGDIRRFTDRLYATLHTPQQREIFLKALTQTLHTLGHHDLTAMAAHWQAHSEPESAPA